MRLVIFALVIFCGSVANAAIPGGGKLGDDRWSLIYNPADGNLKLDARVDVGKSTGLEVQSVAGYFTGTRPPQANGVFDVFTKNKFLIIKPAGAMFGDVDFGPAMAKGLSMDQLTEDLTVAGSTCCPAGFLRPVDLIYVPEPSSLSLSLLVIAGILISRSFRIS